jgi:hypothetical protein
MNEAQWQSCSDPGLMLELLRGKVSDRKMRLFACAWCRRHWSDLPQQASRDAVEAVEQYLEGQAANQALTQARTLAREAAAFQLHQRMDLMRDAASTSSVRRHSFSQWALTAIAAYAASEDLGQVLGHGELPWGSPGQGAANPDQASLLREVVSNPFRSVVLDPAWLTPTVRAIAQVAYREHILPQGQLDAGHLGVLADALEEAGCSEWVVLDHLRTPGPHVRGCWALDLCRGLVSTVTLESLTATHPDLLAVAEEAARQGLRVGCLLGAGSYGAVFAATSLRWGECVLKVAGVDFAGPRDVHDGESGPYRIALPHSLYHFFSPSPTLTPFPCAPATLEQAASLLQEACQRQQRLQVECPLARLLASLRLGGRVAALFERLRGPSLRSLLVEAPEQARATVPALARALLRLHETFGAHGDLKPDHVFVDRGEVVFIDPLPETNEWIGSLGYTPLSAWAMMNDRLKDLGSLAAILAELWGGTVGWEKQLTFDPLEFEPSQPLEVMREGTAAVPAPVRSWILEVGQAMFGNTPADSGWCRSRLIALAGMFGPDGLPEGGKEPSPVESKRWWQFWT